jgi:hypothetical protein
MSHRLALFLVALGIGVLSVSFESAFADTCLPDVVKRADNVYIIECVGNCTGGGTCSPRAKAGSTSYFCGCQNPYEPACCTIGISGGTGSGETLKGTGVTSFGACGTACGTPAGTTCTIRPGGDPNDQPDGTSFYAICQ